MNYKSNMTAVQWTDQASSDHRVIFCNKWVINQRNMKWLFDKNTHRQSMMWKKSKEKQLWGHRPHCSEGGRPRERSVGAHSSGIYTPTAFISAHNGADLHLHGPERLQFSALGEKRGVKKKALSKALSTSLGGFNESADRHRKYSFCLPFKEERNLDFTSVGE